MINLDLVQFLRRICTGPYKELYKEKKGSVQILFYIYVRK